MFDFVRRNNRWLQLGLALVIIPSFVFVGIEGYRSFGEGNETVATVGGRAITRAEWDAAHRNQAERLRAQSPDLDPKLLDTPQFKQRVLDELIRERVMFEAVNLLHLAPSDERLQRLFRTDPQFASLRNPDGTVKRELLDMQGMTSDQFAARLRQDMALRQVMQGVASTGFASTRVATTAADAFYQQREAQILRFSPQDQLAKVQPTEADLKAYYDDARHAAQFQSPESASVEYVVLDLATAMKSVTVADDDLRKYYDENQARYEQPQERRARHILIKTDAQASADAQSKAKASAEGILAELRKNPAQFADLARKRSDDPGSAAQGGDLDWFGRGAMTPAFETAVFALKKGELSGVVETEFGFHIIELTDQRGGDKRSFDSVRAEIDAEVRKQLGQKRFVELAEQLTNLAEQEDTLAAVADKLKLTVQRNDKLLRQTPADPASPLTAAKVVETIFQPQNLSSQRNLEPVEAGANLLVSARVLQHSPARKLPLAEVKATLEQSVRAELAAAAARKEGQARLAEWKAKPDGATLPAPVVVSRAPTAKLPREIVDAVLRAPAEPLPAWVGVDLGSQGYAVVRVQKVLAPDPAATGDADRLRTQYAQVWSQAESEAYYSALRTRFKTEVSDKAKPPAAASANQP